MIFAWILLLLGNIHIQVTLGERMSSVIPREKEKIVRMGESVELLCQHGQPLDNCQFDMPSGRSLTLRPGKTVGGLSYYGEGYEKGHCGLRIESVTEGNNGQYTCTVNPAGNLDNLKANISVVVAKAPNAPVITMTSPLTGSSDYKEGETITATCRIEQGRPAANLSWYIGDEKITDGKDGIVEIKNTDGITTVIQNFTRRLQATDNGKMLKCVGSHPLLSEARMTASRNLYVLFGPKALDEFVQFGLIEGEEGRVSVIIPANPKPTFTWFVNDEQFHEGQENPSKRHYVLPATESREKGPGYWDSVMIIRGLLKEDVDQRYRVKATNRFGEQTYNVRISTSPEPKPVIDLGFGTIFTIVVGVLIVLVLTALLVFARAKGRWCFSGDKGPTVASESSDTESAAERASHITKKPTFKIFRKTPAKSAPQETPLTDVQVAPEEPKPDEEGVVYAELDLKNSGAGTTARLVRADDEKTEYAEILYTGKGK